MNVEVAILNRMLQSILNIIGRRMTDRGTLIFRAPSGQTWSLGHGDPTALVNLRDASVLRRIMINPRLILGEAYMDHDWEPDNGDLRRVLEVALRMLSAADDGSGVSRSLQIFRNKILELNNPLRARRNIHQHYDLDYALYSRFLDRDMHYSCAYFRDPDMTLEDAQQEKCAHIARKLNLQGGERILDIGCGWGGMAMFLAEHYDAKVVGITLSEEQARVARARAAERGLQAKVEIRLEDYRKTAGRFDAVVSIGMFEHVGRPQYGTYFRRVRELLAEGGTALIHSIGRSTPPGGTNPWIQKYIFPGGYIPAASEMLAAIERNHLILTDLEVLRIHYARTLNSWGQRFAASRDDIASRMGERFCRMWEFYLHASEMSFYWGDLVVFQAQMTNCLERLPLTRNYLYANSQASENEEATKERICGNTSEYESPTSRDQN